MSHLVVWVMAGTAWDVLSKNDEYADRLGNPFLVPPMSHFGMLAAFFRFWRRLARFGGGIADTMKGFGAAWLLT